MMFLYRRLQIKRYHEKTVTGNFSHPLRYFTCALCIGQSLDSNYRWFTGYCLRVHIDYLWNHWSNPGIEKRLTVAFLNAWNEWEKSAKGERREVTQALSIFLNEWNEWGKMRRKGFEPQNSYETRPWIWRRWPGLATFALKVLYRIRCLQI